MPNGSHYGARSPSPGPRPERPLPRRPAPAVLVLAPTYQDAVIAAVEYDLGEPGKGWRYVATPRDIQGIGPGGRYLHVERADAAPSVYRADLTRDAVAAFSRHGWRSIS